MKRSDLVPGVQFQIKERDGKIHSHVFTFDYLDLQAKYPVEVVRIDDGTDRGQCMNVNVRERSIELYMYFGGCLRMRSDAIPLSRLVPVTSSESIPESKSNPIEYEQN